ncbi:SusC/RagA family TonB-linked outer membrane protein [Sinomicrobium weinanense]|uniref:TonB-dependent receptor n=1 Tax=Sinomicrobium weinanense TaxID=2842200 RepID=A0A926Q472_9FLAO|nr:TonB-dependent receptor [Sinomicrobium weinanense]MBC9796555.1 TonB-dependent receptor [Sinomicrobium weinanense]MBU3123058.1 TonB-dependent receptor [Sinomicrobium weinanense]
MKNFLHERRRGGLYIKFKTKIKLSTLFLCIVLLTAQANTSYSQKTRISLDENNTSIAQLIDIIESKSDIRFVYKTRDVDLQRRVSVKAEEEEITSILHRIFDNTRTGFRMFNRQIFLTSKTKEESAKEDRAEESQQLQVNGTVTDENGGPLPGVTVLVKGTQTGTSTDFDGNYEIEVSGQGPVLVFSYIGFVTKEVPVNDQARINVTLKEDVSELDEVIVVAYGTQKKENLTGAVVSVSSDKLTNRPVTSTQNALQGIAPGVTILQRPGDIGRAKDGTSSNTGGITIRGRSNLDSPGPMYIIDGIPATAQEFATLNPNDIANMSVLKDASSAALYGSRAANGVIVVTTKRGSAEKVTIELNTSYGWQSATKLPDYVNSADYARLYNEALGNAGRAPIYTEEEIQKFADGSEPDLYPNTDWYKTVLRSAAPQSEASLSISAPGKVTNYYLGLSYFDQKSLIPGKKQDRIVAKLNTESKVIEDILKVGTNFSFIKQDFDRSGGNMSWTELNRSLPTSVVRQSNGEWGSMDAGDINAETAKRNQLRKLREGGSGWDRDNYLQMAANASLTPLEGLSINGLTSLKYTNSNSWSFDSTIAPVNDFLTGEPMSPTWVTPNEMEEYWRKRQEFLIQGTIDYERRFGEHFGKITLGASQESNIYRTAFVGRKNFPNDDMTTVGSGSGNPEDISSDDDGQANRSGQVEWAMRSLFGRFNYTFADKYLLEANTRIDYSSRFHPDQRRAVFPSFSAGWIISRESFMENIDWLSHLKLRGSWGSLGNQDVVRIGNYFDLLDIGYQYNFEGGPQDGVWQGKGVNKLATWEKVNMTDVGLDIILFNNRLNITADYYIKDTRDILTRRPVLKTYGIPDSGINNGIPYENLAKTRNKGFELTVNYSDKIGEDFRYTIEGNFSTIDNEILSLGGGREERIRDYWIERVGGSVGDFYGYQADGLFADQADVENHAFQSAATAPGDIKYRDINGDGVIDAEDRVVIGNDVPWLNYGFNLGAEYKGLSLEVLTYGVGKVKTYLDNEASFPFFNGAGIKEELKNRWTEDNPDPDADFPRLLLSQDGTQNYASGNRSSFWLFDGSYFRIRAITLGYTFPEEVSSRLGMSMFRVYATSNNPFTFMADKRLADYDPESGSGRGGYPGIKTFSLGFNFRF